MQKRPISIGLVIVGGLVAAGGGLLWLFIFRRWPAALIPAGLILLGIGVVLAGLFGGKKGRHVASQALAQLACILILITVIFPVLWIVGMAVDPRNIIRPLDMSPITRIPANLLQLAPKRFPLPGDSFILHLQPVAPGETVTNSAYIGETMYELPSTWTAADLQRPDVWVLGREVIAWTPVSPLPEGADTVVFPGQVTQLPDDAQVAALVPLALAVRPGGWMVLDGRSYAVPRGWGLKRAAQPTLWLLDNRAVHWGILEPFPEGDLMTRLKEGDQPACWIVVKGKDGEQRYNCPQGYRAEAVQQPAYWLALDHFGLCNGHKSSDVARENLSDAAHFPAIWWGGHAIVDWRSSSLRAFAAVLKQPTTNPVGFPRLLLNSTMLGASVALFCVLVGTTAAYAFSRFTFPGRQAGMLGFVLVLMLPSVGMLAPLYTILNAFQVAPSRLHFLFWIVGSALGLLGIALILWNLARKVEGWRWLVLPLGLLALGVLLDWNALRSMAAATGEPFILRNSLWGVGIAMVAGALPFSIWNMKGFIDTIPKELEESARIDGASPSQTFFQIMLPLAVPGVAVTALFGFMSGWTEFILSWQFLNDMKSFTLTMALYGMQGQYSSETPWSNFAAMSILISIPVTAVFFALQRYIVSGLTVGAVKG